MPTTVITGRDITLTVATVNYDAQTTSAVLSADSTIETYQTLDGKAYKHIDDQWKLDIEMLADWGVVSSLNEALWNAAESAPNTVLAVNLIAFTGASWAFNVLPVFPNAGGSGETAQTLSLSFIVVGTPVKTFTIPN